MSNILFSVLLVVIGFVFGLLCIIIINHIRGKALIKKLQDMMNNATKEAEAIKQNMIAEAKVESSKYKEQCDEELKEKKKEVKELEERLIQREANIDRRDLNLSNRENLIDEKEKKLSDKQIEIQEEQSKIGEMKKQEMELLESISHISKDEARNLILKKTEEEMTYELETFIKESENKAKLEADKKAKSLLVSSMQKYANDVTNETAVTVVSLPNDEMKGRLIGREGRNIRTIEAVTGVDLIIDDTPEAIVLSSFDPLRREIARITIETLIKDGRIHPSRIEELYDKTVKEMNNQIREYGESALYELGITKMEPELIEIIGKLYFRTSYGQNALQHSMEVAHLAGIMASELGENVSLAKRAGLLHDIGKAVDFEMEGSHVEIGIDLAKKYKEDDVVINSIASHHGDTEATSIIANLIEIADILSASRPGARNDSLENYIKRLEQLEKIANSFDGIEKSYAMQAGRELRIIVKPDEVDEVRTHKIARDIKTRIESEMQYPGTVKVTVIRETRAQEEAR